MQKILNTLMLILKKIVQSRKSYLTIAGLLLVVFGITLIIGRFKPLPEGLTIESDWQNVEKIEFLYDLTYRVDGEVKHEQQIFQKIYKVIQNAEELLVIDMFLFNDEYNRKYNYPKLSTDLISAVIKKKKACPNLQIHIISDPINSFYGAYDQPGKLQRLVDAEIPLTLTNLNKLRHSNTIYTALYAPFMSHFGVKGKGWLSNPFSPDSPPITLRAMLKMLNFRANHRKVICSEKELIVSSANPHDASAYHCNIAFYIQGGLVEDLLKAEKVVADFSGAKSFPRVNVQKKQGNRDQSVKLITEGQIRSEWCEAIDEANTGDSIQIAMFYMSERSIINSIKRASKRGVKFKLILDSNKDAFGREKNGVPNRQVASELMHKCGENVEVKWYHTEGEQFHSKLMIVDLKSKQQAYLIGGSANLTRRNIGNYNLEADVCVKLRSTDPLLQKTTAYFQRMWNNQNGLYTDDYETFQDDSFPKKVLYRLQEFTGLCTF